jgi:hypothetical protein
MADRRQAWSLMAVASLRQDVAALLAGGFTRPVRIDEQVATASPARLSIGSTISV